MRPLRHWLQSCEVCPNFCRVDRTAGQTGRCHVDDDIVVSSANLHFGEEPCLVGSGGSGAIFLTGCNLHCVFCQNSDISQPGSAAEVARRGTRISRAELGRLMLELQTRGAENVNLVSPTHQAPQLFEAVQDARERGLRLPIVYNCGGYENPEFLKELEGLVDIYMPDFKYGDDAVAARLSDARDYVRWCKASLREMHRQVGDLILGLKGVAASGLLIRHLVLPERLAGSRAVIDFLVSEISPGTFLNIMDQYRPAWHASEFPELRRRVLRQEVEEVISYARARGMTRFMAW